MSRVPVSTLPFGKRTVQVYDSGYIFPLVLTGATSGNDFTSLKVPSTRYYYLGTNGSMIPIPSTTYNEQGARDLKAWKHGLLEVSGAPVVYARQTIEAGNPESDLFQVLAGAKVSDYDVEYIKSVTEILRAQGFPVIGRAIIETLLKNPPNPAGDIFQAIQLAQSRAPAQIQRYLDAVGVVHFTAQDVVNLETNELFFYLSRFYPAPPNMRLSEYVIMNRYRPLVQNERARSVVSRLTQNLPVYHEHREAFEAYFVHINADPDNPAIWTGVGGTNQDRFYRDFFQYLKLLIRPSRPTLPPLTLNTIHQLHDPTRLNLASFLLQYFDQEIIALAGASVDQAETRRELATEAADVLLNNRYLLLLPMEAGLCKNKETIFELTEFKELTYPFAGRGNFATGFDCYDVADLFIAFEKNRRPDGTYAFLDPRDYRREMTRQDLVGIRDAFLRGRPGTPVTGVEGVVRELDRYISLLALQASRSYDRIISLRNWARSSPENTQLISSIWNSYFRMAMYMRQWKGPGNPYPVLARETGHEEARGTVREEDISEAVQKEGSTLKNLLGQLPEPLEANFWGLLMYRVEGGQFTEDRGKTITAEYHNVVELGNSCVRVASAPWAYTAIFYLKQTVDQEVPGFPLSVRIELIS